MQNETVLRKLQMMELQILNEVIKLCEQNNIKYYLIGGTLLGAVRHSGFIPWDDDIDIGMLRKDYDNFNKVCDTCLAESLYIQNKEHDKRVDLPITKIRKNGTKIIEKENLNMDCHKGVFIDIFPLDNIPEKDNFILESEYFVFMFLQSIALYKNGYREYRSKTVKLISSIFRFLPYAAINKITHKIMTRHNKKETGFLTSYASGYGYKKQRMSKNEIYGAGVKILFEGKEFTAPTNYVQLFKKSFLVIL